MNGASGPDHVPGPVLLNDARRGSVARAVSMTKKFIKRVVTALEKRSSAFRKVSRAAVKRKRHRNYRLHHEENAVIDRMVIFESFQGRSYSCSPKALYLAMRADPRFAGFRFVWAFKSPADYLDHPDMRGAELVRYKSQEYFRAYAQAKYWISNSRLTYQIQPKAEQVYVQAWHGTPLKRIGCDLDRGQNALYSSHELFDLYSREGERMSMLLSPSRFATERLTTSFNLDGLGRESIIVEEGYPRNDFLRTFTPDDVCRIRAELDLPADKKVVLYAPTWRENQHTSGLGFTYDVEADFDRMREDLGSDYVVLFRAHYFIANDFDFARYEGFIRDVSKVDDINELYVVSDVLVTDYSSVFFDFANLGRPIIFYMYDLAEYANEMRGFYLDLAELPGPIVKSEDELVRALRAAESPDADLAERYARFQERFVYLDDGRASERVIERILARGALVPADTTCEEVR